MTREEFLSIIKQHKGSIYAAVIGFSDVKYVKCIKSDILKEFDNIGDNQFIAYYNDGDINLYIDRYMD